MRGALARFVGIALSTALLGLGCGDDTVATPDGPNIDAPVDRPIDGHADAAMPDAAPFFSVSMAAFEAHGTVAVQAGQPIKAMVAGVSISVTPSTFTDDIPSPQAPFGCAGNEFNLAAGDLPARNGDMGMLTITGYSGRGGGVPPGVAINATTHCTIAPSPNPLNRYVCDLPADPIVEGPNAAVPANFIDPGDNIMFTIAGGADLTGFTKTLAAAPSASATAPNLVGPNPFPLNADLIITVTCVGGTTCGAVTVNMTSNDNVNPSGNPTHFASITCSKLITSGLTSTITVPANYLALIGNTPWKSLRTTVLRFGAPDVDALNHRVTAAGQGEFYIATSQ